jgi:Sulfatase
VTVALVAKAASPRFLLAPALLWAALVLVRMQIVTDLRLGPAEALAARVYIGWLYDAAATVLVVVAATVVGRTSRLAGAVAFGIMALLLWLGTGFNAGHFHFFGATLDWWIVRLHWRDLGDVSGSIAEYVLLPFIAASVVALAGSWVAVWVNGVVPVRAPVTGRWRVVLARAQLLLSALVVMFVGVQLPTLINKDQPSMAVSDQVWRLWWDQNTRHMWSRPLYAGAGTAWSDELGQGRMERAAATLASFRDYHDGAPPPVLERYAGDYPLVRQLAADPVRGRRLRTQLGLPSEGPVHVIVLMLETTRSFEIEHPDLGPQVFPRLRRLLADHAINFTQAYSSSFGGGPTVRAQFSTSCSLLPNVLGAAPYLAHPTVRVTCLQEFLRVHGYNTVWMNSHKADHHGVRQFEMLHGNATFFDEAHFLARGVTQRIGAWGLADKPFLHEALGTVEELAARGAPVYAQILTLNTHGPHTVVPEGPVSDALLAATVGKESYRAYLSRLRYSDDAVSSFFEDLFKGQLGGNTVVILLGDHSTAIWSTVPVDPVQRLDQLFRIPIAIVTRDMPSPRRVDHPVHQVDVAPTVADILGLGGKVTWVGRSLLGDEGTPWVYQQGADLHYRTRSVACYTRPGKRALSCFDTRAADPQFATSLAPVQEDPALSEFFRRVLRADRQVIALNQVAPATSPAR